MTEKLEFYKCDICGNFVQIILNGVGELVCCGEKMNHLIPKQDEENEISEKHTPIIETKENKTSVTLKKHPMTPEHYIQFIEIYKKDKSEIHLKYLEPNDVAEFNISSCLEEIEALENCNIHGLWKSK